MWKYSTFLVQTLATHKSLKEALQGLVLRVYSDSQPITADHPVNGVLLHEFTFNGDTYDGTPSTAQIIEFEIGSPTEGETFIITIESDIYSYTAIAGDTASTVAAALAALIDQSNTVLALAYNEFILIRARFAGVELTYIVDGTGTITDTELVANVRTNGLQWGAAVEGVLSKEIGTWQSTAQASGTAGWCRVCRYGDAGGLSEAEIRVDGTCGVTDADDLILATLVVLKDSILPLDTFNITIPKA